MAPNGLRRALDELDVLARVARRASLVLWLDRVDRFAGDGLTVSMQRQLYEKSPRLRVVATTPSTRYQARTAEKAAAAAEVDDSVVLNWVATSRETELAGAAYPGVAFAEEFTATAVLLSR